MGRPAPLADLARITRCKQRAAGGFLPRPPGTLILAHTPWTPSGPREAFLYHNPTIILYHPPRRVKVLLVGIRMAAMPGVRARASPTSQAMGAPPAGPDRWHPVPSVTADTDDVARAMAPRPARLRSSRRENSAFAMVAGSNQGSAAPDFFVPSQPVQIQNYREPGPPGR